MADSPTVDVWFRKGLSIVLNKIWLKSKPLLGMSKISNHPYSIVQFHYYTNCLGDVYSMNSKNILGQEK